MEPWMELAARYGLPGMLVLWFIWRAGVREEALLKDQAECHKYVRETLLRKFDEGTTVVATNTSALASNADALRRLENLFARIDSHASGR